MKFQFFHIDAQEPVAGQEALNVFCAQHRVIAVEKQFVAQGGSSFWSLCVSYLEGAALLKMAELGKREAVDYREVLNEQDFAVFAELRKLRKSLADAEGTPAYSLFTNQQLADIVTQRVSSLAELGKIAGVGSTRQEKYGAVFLQKLKEVLAAQPQAPAATAQPEALPSAAKGE